MLLFFLNQLLTVMEDGEIDRRFLWKRSISKSLTSKNIRWNLLRKSYTDFNLTRSKFPLAYYQRNIRISEYQRNNRDLERIDPRWMLM